MGHGPGLALLIGWGSTIGLGFFAFCLLASGYALFAMSFGWLLVLLGSSIMALAYWEAGVLEMFAVYWLWAPPMAIGFAVVFRASLTMRPSLFADHECQTCGYDLTGNISGVCPECGENIPSDKELQEKSTDRRLILKRQNQVLLLMYVVITVSSITVLLTVSGIGNMGVLPLIAAPFALIIHCVVCLRRSRPYSDRSRSSS